MLPVCIPCSGQGRSSLHHFDCSQLHPAPSCISTVAPQHLSSPPTFRCANIYCTMSQMRQNLSQNELLHAKIKECNLAMLPSLKWGQLLATNVKLDFLPMTQNMIIFLGSTPTRVSFFNSFACGAIQNILSSIAPLQAHYTKISPTYPTGKS